MNVKAASPWHPHGGYDGPVAPSRGQGVDIGAMIGRALAALVPESMKARIRARYAQRFGTCRRCDAPLSGSSPQQICEPCHADELLERAGGGPGGDA